MVIWVAISSFLTPPYGSRELPEGDGNLPVIKRRERTRYRSRLCFFRWIYEVAEPSTRDLLRSSPPSKPLRPLMMMSKNCIEALYASTAQRLGTGLISVKHILARGADSARSYAELATPTLPRPADRAATSLAAEAAARTCPAGCRFARSHFGTRRSRSAGPWLRSCA